MSVASLNARAELISLRIQICRDQVTTVSDIGDNNLRLIAFIEFRDNRMYVKHIATHAEYDKLCKRYRKEGD